MVAVPIVRLDPDLVMFSTDEQEIVDVRDLGFMDHRVRMAIEAGVAAIKKPMVVATSSREIFMGVFLSGSDRGILAHVACWTLALVSMAGVSAHGVRRRPRAPKAASVSRDRAATMTAAASTLP